MALHVVNADQVIRQLEQPFTMTELAAVGEIALHGYICLGAVNWHQHVDADELFLVHEGTMVLESKWGNLMLRAGELAVVPKGIAHRSGSQLRTVVILMHTRGLPERKNGHRRLFGIPGQGQLNKVRLHAVAARADPFRLEPVADLDDYAVQLVAGNGMSPTYVNFLSDTLWLAMSGQAQLEVEDESVELTRGELAVVPRDVPHRWAGLGPTTLLWLGQANVSAFDDLA